MNSIQFQDIKLVHGNMLQFCTLTNYQKEKINKLSHLKFHKKIRYLGINLTKEVKDLYFESCKKLMRETEDDTNKRKDILCSCIERINIFKMFILPKAIYRFNVIPIKIPMTFFKELQQIILKCIWNHKRPQIPKQSWKEEQSILQIYSNQTVWYCQKNRNIDQWNNR